MLVGLIIVGVLVVAAIVAAVARQRTHDDEHSVEGYHRQLHTLEVLRGRQEVSESTGSGDEPKPYPESAFRVATHSTVRLTDPSKPVVPPVAPPPVADPSKPIAFDDGGLVVTTPTASGTPSTWREDKAMHGINHRPRRLAAPALAVAAVAALIVVLLVTGNHKVAPHHTTTASTTALPAIRRHRGATSTTTPVTTHGTKHRTKHSTTTTAPAPIVSLPRQATLHGANYVVQPTSYHLGLSATSAQCWVDATDATSGQVLFTGVLAPGQTQTVTASGPVELVIGAPSAFAANINGTGVSFPFGFLAPFTMHFAPAGASTSTPGSTSGSTTTTTTVSSTTTTTS